MNQWNLQSDGDINQDKRIVDTEKRDLNIVDIWFNKYFPDIEEDARTGGFTAEDLADDVINILPLL